MEGFTELFGNALESRNDGGGSECGHHGLVEHQCQQGIDRVLRSRLDAYVESDTRQVDDLFPLRPVIRISRIRRWKRIKVDSAVSLDQVVAMLFGKDRQSIVEFDRSRRQRCVFDIVVLLLLPVRGVLRCDFVVHSFRVWHFMCTACARGMDPLSLKYLSETKANGEDAKKQKDQQHKRAM